MVFTRQFSSSISSRTLMKTKIRSSTRPRSTDCFPSISSIRSPLKPVRLRFENEKGDEFPKPVRRVDFLEDDFQKHFGGETGFDDNESSTWLSANSNSPSSFFNEYRFSGILGSHHVFDDRLFFWLSKLPEAQTLTSPKKYGDLEKDDGAENQVSTLVELDEELQRASVSSSNSSRLSATRNGAASSDSAGLIASLTNQDSLEESGHAFSAPSYPSSGRLETQTSISISSFSPESNSEDSTWSSSPQNVSENEDWESRVGEPEPIFWPFEGKFDCNLEEPLEFLRMSPRRKVMETGGSDEPPVKSVLTNSKFDPKQRPPRQLRRSESKPEKSHNAKLENGKVSSEINSNKKSWRLSKSSKNLAKVVPLEDEGCMIIKKKQTIALAVEKIQVPRMRLEKERSMDEESIESIIGLDEFDGHEGVDAELDQNGESLSHFLLVSPR